MNNDQIISVMGLAIQIGLFALAIALVNKYKSKINEDSSFIKFPPFILLLFFSLDALVTYSYIEFKTIIIDPSDAYNAIEKHGFIGAVLKTFIAGTAICIAWQRSLVVDYQNKMTRESNNISNYYSLQEHCYEVLNSSQYIPLIKSPYTLNNNSFYNAIFLNPSAGLYTPNPRLEEINDTLCSLIINQNKEDDISKIMTHAIAAYNTLNLAIGINVDLSIGLPPEINDPAELIRSISLRFRIITEVTRNLPISSESRREFLSIMEKWVNVSGSFRRNNPHYFGEYE